MNLFLFEQIQRAKRIGRREWHVLERSCGGPRSARGSGSAAFDARSFDRSPSCASASACAALFCFTRDPNRSSFYFCVLYCTSLRTHLYMQMKASVWSAFCLLVGPVWTRPYSSYSPTCSTRLHSFSSTCPTPQLSDLHIVHFTVSSVLLTYIETLYCYKSLYCTLRVILNPNFYWIQGTIYSSTVCSSGLQVYTRVYNLFI